MTYVTEEHPVDDMLIAYTLEGGDDSLREHIESCPSCSRYIKEIRAIRYSLKTLPEIDAPVSVRQDILRSITRRKLPGGEWLSFECSTWYKNPLFIGLGLMGLVVLVYVFFVFIL